MVVNSCPFLYHTVCCCVAVVVYCFMLQSFLYQCGKNLWRPVSLVLGIVGFCVCMMSVLPVPGWQPSVQERHHHHGQPHLYRRVTTVDLLPVWPADDLLPTSFLPDPLMTYFLPNQLDELLPVCLLMTNFLSDPLITYFLSVCLPCSSELLYIHVSLQIQAVVLFLLSRKLTFMVEKNNFIRHNFEVRSQNFKNQKSHNC